MTEGTFEYDLALKYARDPLNPRVMPRLAVAARFFPGQERLHSVVALIDSGAEVSAFDGSLALAAGWSFDSIVDKAISTQAISGINAGLAIQGFLHEVFWFVGEPLHFAELKFRVLITPPNTLAFSILGRHDFFEQVDVAFAELDQSLFLRFRDRSVLRDFR